jgi:Tfp pilus assembly protein PilP
MKIIILIILFSGTNLWAQSSSGRKYRFFKNIKTAIKKPFELRDPFVKKSKIIISTRRKKKRFGTSFSNRKELYSIKLENLRVVGVFLGKQRKALAKIIKSGGKEDEPAKFEPETYILKEGMRLGENRAEIKAILPGGIVLVERIKNVYDQDELLETIMPLYTDN